MPGFTDQQYYDQMIRPGATAAVTPAPPNNPPGLLGPSRQGALFQREQDYGQLMRNLQLQQQQALERQRQMEQIQQGLQTQAGLEGALGQAGGFGAAPLLERQMGQRRYGF